jgi:hypothetical protein
MAVRLGLGDPDDVRRAVDRLVELGLVGVQKRGAGRSHSYAMCLPRKQAAALQASVVRHDAGDDIPPL